MIKSEEFIAPKRTERGIGQLEVHPSDAPLVAHFSGNDPAVLLAAAKRAERLPGVVAIDLNLGCPQRSAHSGHFGAFLCVEPRDRHLVLTMVATLARALSIPVFCKIRLLDDGVDAGENGRVEYASGGVDSFDLARAGPLCGALVDAASAASVDGAGRLVVPLPGRSLVTAVRT